MTYIQNNNLKVSRSYLSSHIPAAEINLANRLPGFALLTVKICKIIAKSIAIINDYKAFPENTLSSVQKISLSGKVGQVEVFVYYFKCTHRSECTHTQIHFNE